MFFFGYRRFDGGLFNRKFLGGNFFGDRRFGNGDFFRDCFFGNGDCGDRFLGDDFVDHRRIRNRRCGDPFFGDRFDFRQSIVFGGGGFFNVECPQSIKDGPFGFCDRLLVRRRNRGWERRPCDRGGPKFRTSNQFHRLARGGLHSRAGAARTELFGHQVVADEHLRRFGGGFGERHQIVRFLWFFFVRIVGGQIDFDGVVRRNGGCAIVEIRIEIQIGFAGVQRVVMLGRRHDFADRKRFALFAFQRRFVREFFGDQTRADERRGADEILKLIHFQGTACGKGGIVAERCFTDGDGVAELQFLLAHGLAVDVSSRARTQITDVAPTAHGKNDGVRGGAGVFDKRDIATGAPADEHDALVDDEGEIRAFHHQLPRRRVIGARPLLHSSRGLELECE